MWLKQRLHFGHEDGVPDVKPESLIKKVLSVSQLSFVVPSALWGGSVGTVPKQWQPFSPFVSRTYDLPACGAVQSGLQATLALLEQRQTAFILKHIDREDYVLTEPLAGGAAPATIQQLFALPPMAIGCSTISSIGTASTRAPLRCLPGSPPWSRGCTATFCARRTGNPALSRAPVQGLAGATAAAGVLSQRQ